MRRHANSAVEVHLETSTLLPVVSDKSHQHIRSGDGDNASRQIVHVITYDVVSSVRAFRQIAVQIIELNIITGFQIEFRESNVISSVIFQTVQSILANGRSSVVVIALFIVLLICDETTIYIVERNNHGARINTIISHFVIQHKTIAGLIIAVRGEDYQHAIRGDCKCGRKTLASEIARCTSAV